MKPLITLIMGLIMLVGLGAFGPPVDMETDDVKIVHMQSDTDLELTPDELEMLKVQAEIEYIKAAESDVLKPEEDYAEYAKAPVMDAKLNQRDAHTLQAQKYRPSAHLNLIKQYNHRLE